MKIINAMFGCGLGGIEQCSVDYARALESLGHSVLSAVQKRAAIRDTYESFNLPLLTINNHGQWDSLAKFRLYRAIKRFAPDAIITHGNRALHLLKPCRKFAPIIGVTHNYSLKHLVGCNGIIVITENLRNTIHKLGQPKDTIFKVPNMVDESLMIAPLFRPHNDIPVIGTMGRFIKKKGFDVFLTAIAILAKERHPVKAIIGGTGLEEENLKAMAKKLEINHLVEFRGWIQDKTEFFNDIDIFCLPSLSEPFGIALLEAFAHGVPTITSNTKGPSEIATHEHDALIIKKNNPAKLATAINNLAHNIQQQHLLSIHCRRTIEQHYSMRIVNKQLEHAIQSVSHTYRNQHRNSGLTQPSKTKSKHASYF